MPAPFAVSWPVLLTFTTLLSLLYQATLPAAPSGMAACSARVSPLPSVSASAFSFSHAGASSTSTTPTTTWPFSFAAATRAMPRPTAVMLPLPASVVTTDVLSDFIAATAVPRV